MESVSCDLCGSDKAIVLFEGYDRWFRLPGRFPVRKCTECGLIYLSPRPDRREIAVYYPESYSPYQPAIEEEPSAWRRFNRRYALGKQLRLVRAVAGTPSVALDVGCATGIFLDGLRRNGWQVQGVEVDGRAVQYARARLGLPVFHGELVDAAFADQQYDLVTLWDVLEHVHEPRATLAEVARITRPGGTLILGLPNPNGWEAQWFGATWAGWDCPRHLYAFTWPVISRMLAVTGWRIDRVTGHSARMWLLLQSLRYRLEERNVPVQVRKALLAIAGNELARAVCIPYFALVERLGVSSGTVVVGKRQGG